MADIKQQADLMHTLPFNERRLKKVERQLSVPRNDYSIVATEQTMPYAASPAALSTVDTVQLVTTDFCIISFYIEASIKTDYVAAIGRVYLRDVDSATTTQVLSLMGSSYGTQGSVAGSITGSKPGAVPNGPITQTMNTAWTGGAGKHTWSLLYDCDTVGQTATFKNRKLFAWVTPF